MNRDHYAAFMQVGKLALEHFGQCGVAALNPTVNNFCHA